MLLDPACPETDTPEFLSYTSQQTGWDLPVVYNQESR